MMREFLVSVCPGEYSHTSLPPSLTKGSLPIKTIGEACRQQAQALMQALILYAHERLQLGQRGEDIFGYLFAKQQPALAT